jgi:RimJ/RimL family protein N-acetyltransferase
MHPEHTPLSYIAIQAQTLYRLDERGRLLCVNEPDEPPAPRFFMGRTPEGNIWRLRHDLPDDLAAELERLCRAEPVPRDLTAPPAGYQAIRAALQEHAPVAEEWRGPCYRFPDTPPDLPGAVVLTEANIRALPDELAWIGRALPLYAPAAVALVNGRAVSLCFCSRIGERACEAGLETLPRHRGRGHAAAVTALWARLVRRRGLTPLYSTSWDNLASRGVARRLGMILYGEDLSLS